MDIQGPSFPIPRFETRAKMRWDNTYLYVGAYLEEPQVWAYQKDRNSIIFYDNDFEVFVDPNWSNSYYKEFEMNAINTTWNLYLNKPYMDGGSPKNDWDINGIKTAVYVEGEVNNPNVTCKYWTVEIALPLKSLIYLQNGTGSSGVNNVTAPPKHGDQWRINFSRVEYWVTVVNNSYVKTPGIPEDNWVWTSQNSINMHIPEKWGIIQFSSSPVNTTSFVPDPYWNLRNTLLQTYYGQRQFSSLNGYNSGDLKRLPLPSFVLDGSCSGIPTISPNNTMSQVGPYVVNATDKSSLNIVGYINNERLLWVQRK